MKKQFSLFVLVITMVTSIFAGAVYVSPSSANVAYAAPLPTPTPAPFLPPAPPQCNPPHQFSTFGDFSTYRPPAAFTMRIGYTAATGTETATLPFGVPVTTPVTDAILCVYVANMAGPAEPIVAEHLSTGTIDGPFVLAPGWNSLNIRNVVNAWGLQDVLLRPLNATGPDFDYIIYSRNRPVDGWPGLVIIP